MVPGLSDSSGLGFDFDLCKRNEFLEKQGLKTLKPWSTGTTICGVVFKVRDEEKARSSDRTRRKDQIGVRFPAVGYPRIHRSSLARSVADLLR